MPELGVTGPLEQLGRDAPADPAAGLLHEQHLAQPVVRRERAGRSAPGSAARSRAGPSAAIAWSARGHRAFLRSPMKPIRSSQWLEYEALSVRSVASGALPQLDARRAVLAPRAWSGYPRASRIDLHVAHQLQRRVLQRRVAGARVAVRLVEAAQERARTPRGRWRAARRRARAPRIPCPGGPSAGRCLANPHASHHRARRTESIRTSL